MEFHFRNRNLAGRRKQNRRTSVRLLHFTGLLRGPVLSSGKRRKLGVMMLR